MSISSRRSKNVEQSTARSDVVITEPQQLNLNFKTIC